MLVPLNTFCLSFSWPTFLPKILQFKVKFADTTQGLHWTPKIVVKYLYYETSTMICFSVLGPWLHLIYDWAYAGCHTLINMQMHSYTSPNVSKPHTSHTHEEKTASMSGHHFPNFPTHFDLIWIESTPPSLYHNDFLQLMKLQQQ